MKKVKIKKGDRYKYLTVTKEVKMKENGERMFICKCNCGNIVTVQMNNLRSGNTNSCGCYKMERNNTEESRIKSKNSHRKRVKEGKNNMWKGINAGYVAIHIHLKKYLGKPTICENKNCKYPRNNSKGVYLEKPKRYEWANITGNYTGA